jgi:thioester reductase-like protein
VKGVLVTGATGFVGSRVVTAYLDRTEHRVFALVRGRSDEEAGQRLRDVLRFWEVPEDRLRDRVVVCRGDVSEPGLGIGPPQLEAIVQQVAQVVHAASPIRLDLPLATARAQILSATEHAFEVFTSCRHPERFGFVSTLEVCGDFTDTVFEEFLTDYPRDFLNTYEVAKFEAEERLRGHIDDGWDVVVFRPGMVVGEAATGKALQFQTFYLILERMLLRPLFPVMPRGCPLDTIPVDVLAAGITALMNRPPGGRRVFHFTQGIQDTVSFADFLDMVQPLAESRLGHPIRRPRSVSPRLFDGLIRLLRQVAPGRARRRLAALQVFLQYFHYHWRFDTSQARGAMADAGVPWPRFDEYLPILLDYYFAHRDENRLPL